MNPGDTMSIPRALLLALVLLTQAGLAAPRLPRHFDADGRHLTTHSDEFGSRTLDEQGRLLVQVDGQWGYATTDSTGPEPRLSSLGPGSLAGGPPEGHAAYRDPQLDARVRAFDSQASEILPVQGPIALTLIFLDFGSSWDPADPQHFWFFGGQELDPAKFHDQIFLEDYAATYPDDVNEAGYETPGSANDWWLWSSHGRSRLVPDESRYPAGYSAPRPGWIVDPAGGPFVFQNALLSGAEVWDSLAALGIDLELDPRRPIVFVTRGLDGSHAHYGGYVNLDMEQFEDESPLTIGVLLHELGHACLQLPDLYFDDQANGWQLMSEGGMGYQDPVSLRHELGYPSDICPAFKELIGWEQPIRLDSPGEYPLDAAFAPFCLVNPQDPREKLFISSWSTICPPGFMCRHVAEGGGRLLIQHSTSLPGWRFQDKPFPRIVRPVPGAEAVTWPAGENHSPLIDRWQDGSWFPWLLDTTPGGEDHQPLALDLAARPAPGATLALLFDSLLVEVPLGGAGLQLRLLNLGPSFSDWELSLGDETVSGHGPVAYQGILEAWFPPTVWGADRLGTRLDLPLQLHLQSPDTTLQLTRLQPFVGLPPSGWSLPVSAEALVESHGENLLRAEESVVTLFVDGEETHSLLLESAVEALCFAGDPAEHVALRGDGWISVLRVEGGAMIPEAGWPRRLEGLDAFLLCDLPEAGWGLVLASGNHLRAYALDDGHELFDILLPDYVAPVAELAFAAHDPAGELGSRFCLVGGVGRHWVHVTNASGDSLYARDAGPCGRLKQPLSLDLLGNGQYDFALNVLSCSANGNDYQEELWLISHSRQAGHHGAGILDLGRSSPGYESGIECLVPFPNTDYPARAALVSNDFFPYSDFMTDIRLLDLGHNEPETRVLEAVPPRRRWFLVGDWNGDQIQDLYVVDRGEGVRLWQGLGDLQFSDHGLVHASVCANQHPLFVVVGETLQMGFREDGRLRFHDCGVAQWPAWCREDGLGNRRQLPNRSWTPPTGSLNPPDIGITRLGNGDMRLRIQSISYGQRCSSFQVWFSRDRETWNCLAEVQWDGQQDTTWLHSRALQLTPAGFYRVVLSSNLDGSCLWTQ